MATGAYTVVGGMHAVIYTEVLQTIILIIGGLSLLYYSLEVAGGMSQVTCCLPLDTGKYVAELSSSKAEPGSTWPSA